MNALFGFIQRCVIACDECDNEVTVDHKIPRYGELVTPVLPDGWKAIGGLTFCNRHKLEVLIDGRPLPGCYL